MKDNNVQTKEAQQAKIQKPIGLLRQEFVNNIVQTINESELPLLVIEYIFKDIMQDINNTIKQQDNAELAQYQELIKQNGKGTKTE